MNKELCTVYFGVGGNAFMTKKAIVKKYVDRYKQNDNEWTADDEEDLTNMIFESRVGKFGETSDFGQRRYNLYYKNDISIDIIKKVQWNGNKDERRYIEGYLRIKYRTNYNLDPLRDDYIVATNSNCLKGASNRFFDYVAEAFASLESITGKHYDYTCKEC